MAIAYDPEEYIAALGDATPLVNQPGGYQGTIDILNQFANRGGGSYNIPNGGFTRPTSDPTYSSGLNYAQSIAGGQNVPGMIAPGVSYSPEQPGGYTQAQLNIPRDVDIPPPPPPILPPTREPDDPSFFGTGIGGVTIPGGRRDKMPPLRNIFGNNSVEETTPQEFNIEQILQDIADSGIDLPNIPGPAQGPVDMPFPPKQQDQLFIDDRPGLEEILNTDYVVPQVPLNNLLNQNPPQTPVGMSPQELAKTSSQQKLLNLISNKDELSQIPADDGVRNQYQVELNDFINESPINMDTYKEELPVGSAINLGIPAFMESVVPMAIPGLGLAKNISNSFQNDFSPSPSPSPSQSFEPSPVPSYNSGIDYSNIYKFGR